MFVSWGMGVEKLICKVSTKLECINKTNANIPGSEKLKLSLSKQHYTAEYSTVIDYTSRLY